MILFYGRAQAMGKRYLNLLGMSGAFVCVPSWIRRRRDRYGRFAVVWGSRPGAAASALPIDGRVLLAGAVNVAWSPTGTVQ